MIGHGREYEDACLILAGPLLDNMGMSGVRTMLALSRKQPASYLRAYMA